MSTVSSSMKLVTVFQFNMGSPILEGLATVGKFDGKHASLACGTVGHRVAIHDATPLEGNLSAVHSLNINKEVTALAAGRLGIATTKDVLVMGSATTISAYDVERNSDVFYKELPDGVFSATLGVLGGPAASSPTVAAADAPSEATESLLFVGGSCNTFAVDNEGQERHWAVSGANVTAVALVPWGRGGPNGEPAGNRLVSGSEDYELRVYDGIETHSIGTEADKVTRLCAAPTLRGATASLGRYAYALANGTIGVYEQQERSWRVKSKAFPTSFTFVDVDFDGVPELVCTWSNGVVEVRSDLMSAGNKHQGGGELLYQENFGAPATAAIAADYRSDGKILPMICTYDGEVRGLASVETSDQEIAEQQESALLNRLVQEKQQLQFDMKNLEAQIAHSKAQASRDADAPPPPPNSVMLPPNTTIKLRLRPMSDTKSIDLNITASEGAVIRGAFVTGELIFPSGDCSFFATDNPTATLSCPICLEKDVGTELSIAVLVGSQLSDVYQVHDLKFRLPRFSMHVPVQELPRRPTGFVTASISERAGRYHAWLSSCFNTSTQQDATEFRASFVCLRDGSGLELSATNDNGGEFTIRCDNMTTCGDIIQDLGSFLGLQELVCVADFPIEFDSFKNVLRHVEEYNNVRMKLTAEIADSTQMVKALVIKAEDARILNDMRHMRKMYGSLYEVNRELMGEYLKRSNNHNELLAALKEVNTMIQKAGQLRMGQAKARLVNECRAAIKANNVQALFHIIKTGKAA